MACNCPLLCARNALPSLASLLLRTTRCSKQRRGNLTHVVSTRVVREQAAPERA